MATDCRLLMVLPSFAGHGGIQRFNRTLMHSSEQQCSQINVMSLTDGDQELTSVDSAPHVALQGSSGNKIAFAIAAARKILFGDWDVIVIGHINLVSMVTGLVSLRIGRQKPRLVLIAHGIEIWNRIGYRMRKGISKCWRVAAVSTYTRDSLIKQVPKLLPTQCVLFPNAIGQSWLEMQARLEGIQESLTLPDKFLLSVSRLASTEHHKGIVSVIESISSLNDANMHYVIAGRGDDIGFLQRVAERCGVIDRVHIFDGLEDAALATLYRKARAFVLPSGKEGFGIVFLEAMHFGLPVIAARAKGAIDVVIDEETGLLVEYGDVVGIAKAIDRIGSDEALRTKVTEGGKKLVDNGGAFTAIAMTRRWHEILAQA